MINKEFIQHVNNRNITNIYKKYSDTEFNVYWLENPSDNKIKFVVLPSGLDLKNKKVITKIFKNDLQIFIIQVMPFTNPEYKINQKKQELKKTFRFINYKEQTYIFLNPQKIL